MKHTVILGNGPYGKTTLAHKLAENKKSITISANDLFKPIQSEKDTEIIIVENVSCITHINALQRMIWETSLLFIVTSNNLSKSAFKKFTNTQILTCHLYIK